MKSEGEEKAPAVLGENTPIRLGAVVILLGMFGGAAGIGIEVYSNDKVQDARLVSHASDIDQMKKTIEMITKMAVDVAVTREKVENLERARK